MLRGKSGENRKKPERIAAGPEAPGFARSMGEKIGRLSQIFLPLTLITTATLGISYLLWWPIHAKEPMLSGLKSSNSAERGRLSRQAIYNAVLQKPHPAWIARKELEQLAGLGLFAENHSIFEANLSRELAQKYETSPWLERVHAVRLRYPAQIELEFDWRKPAARIANTTMVVDRSGTVLNLMSDCPSVQSMNLPLIAGVISSPTEPGRRVQEKELAEGIELLAAVQDPLTPFKVSTLQREPAGIWVITTNNALVIRWGYFGDDRGDPSTKEKVLAIRSRLGEKNSAMIAEIKVYAPSFPVTMRLREVAVSPSLNKTGTNATPARQKHN